MDLKTARNEKHLTQTELAERSGISRNVIAFVETGARKLQVDAAKQLAPVLGVKWWELFEDDKEGESHE